MLISVCVCLRERDSEKECSSLLKLIYSINHSIWSLFIFTSRMVISASHWALYVLPRRFPSNSKTAEHTFSCNLESKRVPALLGYFTVPKLYGQVPSDLPLTGVRTCRYTSFTHELIYVDAARFKGLRALSCEELRRQISRATWQVVHRSKCSRIMHTFSHSIKVQVLKFALASF